jgi:hypothetical protein
MRPPSSSSDVLHDRAYALTIEKDVILMGAWSIDHIAHFGGIIMLRGLRILLISMVSMAAAVAVTSPAYAGSGSHPYFFAQLSLTNGGHTVIAGGPINWAGDDVWAKIQDVTITQGAVTGTSTANTKVRRSQDTIWWLNVTHSGQFRPGSADAYALAVVHTPDGHTYRYRWESQIQLIGP